MHQGRDSAHDRSTIGGILDNCPVPLPSSAWRRNHAMQGLIENDSTG